MVEASEEVYSSLRRRFKGELLRPSESGYEDARVIWNGKKRSERPPRPEFLRPSVVEGTALQVLAPAMAVW
jgi:hypothetical protein